MSGYRDELQALRHRTDALTDEVDAKEGELAAKDDEIAKLRRRLARLTAADERDEDKDECEREIARLRQALQAALPERELARYRAIVADPPPAKRLRPNKAKRIAGLLIIAVVLVIGTIFGVVFEEPAGFVFAALLLVVGGVLASVATDKRYLGCGRTSLVIADRQGKTKIPWHEVGKVHIEERTGEIRVWRKGGNDWHAAGAHYDAEEATELIEGWREYDQARRALPSPPE